MVGTRVWGAWLVFALIAVPLLLRQSHPRATDYPPVIPATLPRIDEHGVPGRYVAAPLTFLNNAPPDSLRLLPGIGPVLAARIVDARSGQRPFSSWDDMRARVSGIGRKTIARLRHAAEPLPRPVGYWVRAAGVASD